MSLKEAIEAARAKPENERTEEERTMLRAADAVIEAGKHLTDKE